MTDRDNNRSSVLCVLLCYILWGVLPIFWKQLNQLGALYILCTRIVWAAVFCLLLIFLKGQGSQIRQAFAHRKELTRLVCSSIAVCINWGVYIYAVNSGHVLDASLAYYLNPLLSIAIGFFFFHEKLRKLQWVALAIAAAGLLAVVFCYGTFPFFSIVIGGSFAAYGAIKKDVRSSNLVSTFIEALLLSPFALAFLIFSEVTGAGAGGIFSGAQWILLPMAGVVTSVPLILFSFGIKKVSMSLSGILMYVNPTLQMLVGILLYQEQLDLPRLILFISVWIALVLFLMSNKKAKQH